VPVKEIQRRVRELHDFNPTPGFRGCRLGRVYPKISGMQTRAVFEAAAEVQKSGIKVKPEIMIPLVGFQKHSTGWSRSPFASLRRSWPRRRARSPARSAR